MTMNRHESFEELISASLTDELTTAERQRLENIADRLDKEIPWPPPTGSDDVNEIEAAPEDPDGQGINGSGD